MFQERRNRFLVHERARGWHVQYDELQEGASFIRDPSTLTAYDPDALRLSLTLRHRGFEECRIARSRRFAGISSSAARHSLEAREELRTCSVQAERLRAELEQRASEIAASHAELDARNAEITRVNQALEQRDADIERWRAAVDGLTRRLDELHRSLSWRWTAPARAVYRVLRGR